MMCLAQPHKRIDHCKHFQGILPSETVFCWFAASWGLGPRGCNFSFLKEDLQVFSSCSHITCQRIQETGNSCHLSTNILKDDACMCISIFYLMISYTCYSCMYRFSISRITARNIVLLLWYMKQIITLIANYHMIGLGQLHKSFV